MAAQESSKCPIKLFYIISRTIASLVAHPKDSREYAFGCTTAARQASRRRRSNLFPGWRKIHADLNQAATNLSIYFCPFSRLQGE
jgi:hypothetical protein